jgi:hypothetical protein
MSTLHSGAATLPKGFRYRHPDSEEPRTPEPFATPDDEPQPPPLPRPRFKLKKRNASNLAAPTQQFLASVAAADVPMPSIEGGAELAQPVEVTMTDMAYPVLSIPELEDLSSLSKVRGRMFSPPRTPAPGVAPSLSPRRYPDWTIDSAFSSSESSPERESSRPSTSRSTHTSASIFSRVSLMSDDAQFMSPEFEGKDGPEDLSLEVPEAVVAPVSVKGKGKMRKAPWTRAMSHHVWSTYTMYCQDPKVTPFRVGRNNIPPHGVCLRVAREARRSWKGSKTHLAVGNKSGSNTPTADAPVAYIQWPHTCAATRAHLRELCRLHATSSAVRNGGYLSNSPTPFGRTATRHWIRRSTPLRSPSVFSSQDMQMSLTLSTAECMQPTGPLAQLTSSAPEPMPEETTLQPPVVTPTVEVEGPEQTRRRLGSPFMAQSYGPSSSGALAAGFSLTKSTPQFQTTAGPRRNLQSPVRLTRSRSNTQKRRSRQASNEQRKCKRPSLASDLWTDPMAGEGNSSSGGIGDRDVPTRAIVRDELNFTSTSLSRHDDLFVPRANIAELISAAPPLPTTTSTTQAAQEPPAMLALPVVPPPRLGSPFSASSSSFSFPNRLSHPESLSYGTIRRPFATVQQVADESSSSSSGPAASRANLASRLSYINQRLREFRHRDLNRRRSESPIF